MINIKDELRKLKEELKEGLISTHIWSNREKRIIAGYNFINQSGKPLNNLTNRIRDIINTNKFSPLSTFYLVSLENNQKMVVIVHDAYEWYSIIDTKKTNMGLIFNLFIPNSIEILKQLNLENETGG